MLLWTACDDVTGSSNNKESSEAEQISIEVETFDDLPNCTVNREGILAKTTDDGSIYKCSDKQWKTYKSGSSNGTASITCSIKEQEDSSGFLVICGEEVIGEIQNGQNGEQGIPGVDGLSAYEIAKAGGYTGTEAEWIASLKGAKGDQGEPGANGLSAYEIAKAGGYTGTEAEWITSLKGAKGDQGNPGQQGANGLSAYEIAVANGFTGTQAQWLATLQGIQGEQGANGLSAYEIAVANGFTGTQAQWLATLQGIQGEQGANGLSAYEIAVANGYTGTEAQWLATLKGAKGDQGNPGQQGANGLSAYEIAVANGFTGTQAQWLATLQGIQGEQGANGLSAYEIAVANGFTGTQAQWLATLQGIQGEQGANGLSAYEIAVANGFTGTQAQWLATLQGIQGEQGANGLSAYEIAVANGFTGTQAQWLASLKGENGNDGALVIQVVSTTAGLECNAQEIATGFKIVCNGDSIAFIPYSALTPSSSSSNTTASSSSNSSSSQSQGNDSSSSSENGSGGGDLFSSSSNNSSSSQGPISDYGTCAPSITTTYYGDSVTWTFTRNSATFPLEQYANATYQWSFPGGYSLNTTTKTAKSAYMDKGTYSASLVISGDTEHPIECSPSVNVIGSKISCTCSRSGSSEVDVTEGPVDVTWTANCNSTSFIDAYYWNGSTTSGSNTFTHAVTVGTYTPTLRVRNSDDIETSVSCPSVTGWSVADNHVNLTAGQSAILGPNVSYIVTTHCSNSWNCGLLERYNSSSMNGYVETESGITNEINNTSSYLSGSMCTGKWDTGYSFTGIIYLTSGYAKLSCN